MRQFCRFKKRVASQRRGNYVGQAPAVDDNRIPVPEINGGQIAGEDLLGFNIFCAALRQILAGGCVVKKRIKP
jgi:hypothetical protein